MASSFADPVILPRQSYVVTETGNYVSRTAPILGSTSIVVFGKSVIHADVILRGDLKRLASGTAAGGKDTGAAITIGRYSGIGEGTIVRPPCKVYRGVFNYYPVKIGDFVSIGSNCVIQAASIGNGSTIGNNCVLGKFVIVKDLAVIEDGAVVTDGTIVPSLTIFGGFPARMIGTLPESHQETVELSAKAHYKLIKTK